VAVPPVRTGVWTLFLLVAGGAALAAAPARAADLYLAGELAISHGTADSGGVSSAPGFSFPNSGSDTDSSPLYGGAFGYEFSLADLAPHSWDWKLPDWSWRLEIEGIAGRDYELVTDGPDPYLTSVSSWGVLHNWWLDLPVHPAVAWAFGRVPLLEPMTFHLGGGVGAALTELETTNNVFSGSDDPLHLTWQVGAGFDYQLTDRIAVSSGYRYVNLGSFDYPLMNGPVPAGNFTLDLASHEFRAGLRVRFYSVPAPGAWKRPRFGAGR
jgi:opacity protein-like surface antigen